MSFSALVFSALEAAALMLICSHWLLRACSLVWNWLQVVVEDDADGVGAVAVHVDQGVESAFGAGE